MSKLMMLVAAKWREFSNINPNLQSENEPSAPPSTTSEEGYSKPTRASKEAAQKIVEVNKFEVNIISRSNIRFFSRVLILRLLMKKMTMMRKKRKKKSRESAAAEDEKPRKPQKCPR